MYRFPRLLMMLGVFLAVTFAAILGAAPANTASTQPARVVASFNPATLNLTPMSLLPGAQSDATAARAARELHQERAFTGGRKAAIVELERLPIVTKFAMVDERDEVGPPFRR